jgi:hypothetical protein
LKPNWIKNEVRPRIEPRMTSFKPRLELELRPVAAPAHASPGACVYVLLPSLAELLATPGFGDQDPICLPCGARPFDPWALFGPYQADPVLH